MSHEILINSTILKTCSEQCIAYRDLLMGLFLQGRYFDMILTYTVNKMVVLNHNYLLFFSFGSWILFPICIVYVIRNSLSL